MNMLPYSLAGVCVALLFLLYAKRGTDKQSAQLIAKGLGATCFLISVLLVTPWLWGVPDEFEDTGYLMGLAIFPAVTIAILASAGAVKNACTDLWTLSHARTP
jgi:hypothetical protein